MKRLILIIPMAFMLFGCYDLESSSGSDQVLQTATENNMKEMNAQVGMPAIKNFQERKLAKMIFELRDQSDLVCYAYTYSEYNGMYTFLGKCIGFGLPYSVQYTSPEKLVDVQDYGIRSYQANDSAVIPQADPNGLFMPQGLSATWIMLINPETNEPTPVYVEPTITVSPFPLPKRICVGGYNE